MKLKQDGTYLKEYYFILLVPRILVHFVLGIIMNLSYDIHFSDTVLEYAVAGFFFLTNVSSFKM